MYLAAIESRTQRAVQRSRVLMTGTLMTPEGAVAIRIRDISQAGAQVWAEANISANCDAILKRGSFFAAARIIRSSNHNVGLQFYRELSDEEFASAFQQRPAAASAAA